MNWKKLKPQTLALLTTLSAILAVVNGCGIAKVTPENVIVRDTVIVIKERKLVDTIILQSWDTVTTIKDRVRVKLVRVNDTIYVDAECPTDTFIVNTVTIKSVKDETPKRGWEFYMGWAFAILAMLVIIKTVLNKVLE